MFWRNICPVDQEMNQIRLLVFAEKFAGLTYSFQGDVEANDVLFVNLNDESREVRSLEDSNVGAVLESLEARGICTWH